MSEPAAPIRLLVEYDGPDHFLADYADNLAAGGTFILTPRELAPGTDVRLALAFPGLREPIAIDGVVTWSQASPEPGVGVELPAGAGRDRLAALVARIRDRDPAIVCRVVRVLIAEDNPHVAEMLRDGLRASARRVPGAGIDFAFATAENGAAALDLLRAGAFDVVIIDVYLPVVDGTRVIDQARHALKLERLPIIAVSGGGDAARDSALSAGADIFLDKPMRLRQVVDTMRALVLDAR